MTRIVQKQPLSAEMENTILSELRIRTTTAQPAEQYFQCLYPGFRLKAIETSDTGPAALHVYLEPNGDPVCPKCGTFSKRVKDRSQRTIIDVPSPGTERTFVHLPVRRVRCSCGCCGAEHIVWLDSYSRITRRLVQVIQSEVRHSTISEVSRKYGVNWKLVREHDRNQLSLLFSDPDVSQLRRMAIDEFAIHKGHRYATAFMNLDTGQIFAVVKGKTQASIEPVFEWLKQKGVADQIECVAVDMNAGFPAVIEKHLPKADVVYDLFHVMFNFTNDVLIGARKFTFTQKRKEIEQEYQEAKASEKAKALSKAKHEIRGSEWLMVRTVSTLQENQRERLDRLIADNSLFAALYPIAEQLRELWKAPMKEKAAACLQDLVELLEEITEKFGFPQAGRFAQMLKRRADGILSACLHRVGTSRLEGANNKIKVLKRIAYGFKDFDYFALKIKGMLPGEGKTPWCQLDGLKAVIGNRIRMTSLRLPSLTPLETMCWSAILPL